MIVFRILGLTHMLSRQIGLVIGVWLIYNYYVFSMVLSKNLKKSIHPLINSL